MNRPTNSDYRWVKDLGTKLFEKVTFKIGDTIIDEYTFCKQCGISYCNLNNVSWFCISCSHYNNINLFPQTPK